MRTPLTASLALASALTAVVAEAAPGQGTFADPVVIDAFPYAIRGTTVGAPSDVIDSYSCATTLDESGPEVIYRVELALDARLSVWIEGDSATVDVDVHILTSDAVTAGVAQQCAARGNAAAEANLPAGTAYVVIDTYDGDALAGPYVLHVEAIGDAWIDRPVASGVVWRARRFADLAGGPQVVHLLRIDPAAPGVEIRALAASGCQTVAALGQSAGAIAGINGGYFASGCAPVSLLKSGGQLLATNAVSRGAFGVTPAGAPLVQLVTAKQDWPQVAESHGGGPILVQGGAPRSGSDAWAAEGMTSSSFLGANPRTLAGIDAQGHVVFGTVDGRRSNARGMSLDNLAAFCASPDVGLSEAVNLDGGGSSTTWIAGASINGVVNYPSDDPDQETAAHAGSRPCSGGMFVFASPYNHAPRFQTAPITAAAVGAPYEYDADAIDVDVDDTVSYSLAAGPAGMTVDPGTGVVRFSPEVTSVTPAQVELVADDGRGGVTSQAFTLDIEGAEGPPDAGAQDTGAGGMGGEAGGGAGGGGSAGDDAGGQDAGSAGAGGGSAQDGGPGAWAGAAEEPSGCACRSPSRPPVRYGGVVLAAALFYALALLRRTR